jgi:GNAT superfamily N-acetyltransferase
MELAASTFRRTVRPDDADGITELHRRVYQSEYGLGDAFVDQVADGVGAALAAGWPGERGGVWLIDGRRRLRGALALTDEGDGAGRVHWFVLEPELRGRGLGQVMLAELLAHARAGGYRRLELETFSALRAAAALYGRAGFTLEWERERTDWGPPVSYRGYSLDLD